MYGVEIGEIVNAIHSIEEDIYESTGGVEYFNIYVKTNGFECVIKFLDIILWSSEGEDRDYDESKDEYEPFEPFLRRALNRELNMLGRIKV